MYNDKITTRQRIGTRPEKHPALLKIAKFIMIHGIIACGFIGFIADGYAYDAMQKSASPHFQPVRMSEYLKSH